MVPSMPAESGRFAERLGSLGRVVQWGVHELELAALRRAHPLRYLFLEVTRRCNLQCAYCGSSCGPEIERDELSIDQWKEVVQQIARDFEAPQVMVAITGGEPLMKKGVIDLMAEIDRLGFPFGMVTNGHLVSAKTAEKLVAAGIDSITLSMDAPRALNDELRGAGSGEAVAKAVENLRAAGYQGILEIFSTVTTPALAELGRMRDQVAKMRISRWRVSPVMPIGRAAQRPDLVPDAAGVRRLLEFVRTSREDGLLPVPESCEEGFLGRRYEGKVRPYLWACLSGITVGGILCDGRIGACPELADAFVQGDVKRERFRDVWESRYQALRDRSWATNGICHDCEELRRCQGGALHLYRSQDEEPLRCLYQMAVAGQP